MRLFPVLPTKLLEDTETNIVLPLIKGRESFLIRSVFLADCVSDSDSDHCLQKIKDSIFCWRIIYNYNRSEFWIIRKSKHFTNSKSHWSTSIGVWREYCDNNCSAKVCFNENYNEVYSSVQFELLLTRDFFNQPSLRIKKSGMFT